jgi:hypothetical protein
MDREMHKWLVRNGANFISVLGVACALAAFAYQLKSDWAPVALGIGGSLLGAFLAAFIVNLRRFASRPRVFISYAHKDHEFVVKLAEDLRDLGIEPIIDRMQLKVGDDIHAAVDEMIDKADYFLVVISEASKTSSWAQKEIEQANKRGKRILPVVLSTSSIPSNISGVFYADFSKDYKEGVSQLARTFKK